MSELLPSMIEVTSRVPLGEIRASL